MIFHALMEQPSHLEMREIALNKVNTLLQGKYINPVVICDMT